VFRKNRVRDRRRWWQMRTDDGLEGVDGLLLENISRKEEEGCECED